jgi:hypothetical protein
MSHTASVTAVSKSKLSVLRMPATRVMLLVAAG